MSRRPNPELPSDSSFHAFICSGVRLLPKPQSVQVGLPSQSSSGCRLNVVFHDGENRGLRISKRTAEVLIALGFSYEG